MRAYTTPRTRDPPDPPSIRPGFVVRELWYGPRVRYLVDLYPRFDQRVEPERRAVRRGQQVPGRHGGSSLWMHALAIHHPL